MNTEMETGFRIDPKPFFGIGAWENSWLGFGVWNEGFGLGIPVSRVLDQGLRASNKGSWYRILGRFGFRTLPHSIPPSRQKASLCF